MYRLVIEDDEGRTTIVPLIRNQINIGRGEGNTIRLTERNVSRKHAKLLLKNGQIEIEDIQSYNGVWINGTRVKGRSSLRPGDLLEIGDYHLSVQEESADAERNARPSLPSEEAFDDQTPPVGIPPIDGEGDNIQEIVIPDPAVLVLLNDASQETVFDVEWPAIMIGRTEENEIAIDHASISRHHAKIVCEEGVYKLYDLDSANGVLVNGQEFKVCDLRWGDVIELGEIRLQFTQATEELMAQASKSSVANRATPASRSLNLNVIIGATTLLILLGMGGIYTVMKQKGSQSLPKPVLLRKAPSKDLAKVNKVKNSQLALQQEQEKQLTLAKSLCDQENYRGALQILQQLRESRANWKKANEFQRECEQENKFYKLIQESIELRTEGKFYESYAKLSQIPKKSKYTGRANDAKKQMAPKAMAEVLQKVRQAVAQKSYFVAMQWNSKALDIEPNNEEAKRLHKEIEKKTAPSVRSLSTAPPVRRSPAPARRRARTRPKPPANRAAARREPPVRRRKSKPLFARCKSLMAAKRYLSAQRCLQRMLRRNGENSVPRVHLFLGDVAAARGSCFNSDVSKRKPLKCLQARYHYNQFVRLEPNSPEAKKLKKRLKASSPKPSPR